MKEQEINEQIKKHANWITVNEEFASFEELYVRRSEIHRLTLILRKNMKNMESCFDNLLIYDPEGLMTS